MIFRRIKLCILDDDKVIAEEELGCDWDAMVDDIPQEFLNISLNHEVSTFICSEIRKCITPELIQRLLEKGKKDGN
jgi:hypothetical protein